MKKLAIIGSGISAMAAAYYLRNDFKISIFEKEDYLGGHTHTHHIKKDNEEFTLDSGFMVFNHATYPNLLKLFAKLGVKEQKSNMSFAVANHDTGLEYASSGFDQIFAQRKNLSSLKYWKFLLDIIKFFKIANKMIEEENIPDTSIESFCKQNKLSKFFRDNYLVPMTAAVWSTPHKNILDFPISLLLPFFHNHGLLGLNKQHQWYTVKGGSDTYTKKIVKDNNFDIHLNEPAVEAIEKGEGVYLRTSLNEYNFDYVLLACHSYESLKIASGLSQDKKAILKKFDYNRTKAVLHTDESVMPKEKRAWAAWTQVMRTHNNELQASTHYWLNVLQKPATKTNYFCSINPWQDIDPAKTIKIIDYRHPLFTVENFSLQDRLKELNINSRILFAGAYFGYGFHEDGLKAGLAATHELKKNL